MNTKLITELSRTINEILLLEYGPSQLAAAAKKREKERLERVRWMGLTDEQREAEASGFLDAEKIRLDAQKAKKEEERNKRRTEWLTHQGYDPNDPEDQKRYIDRDDLKGVVVAGRDPGPPENELSLRDRWARNRNQGGRFVPSDFNAGNVLYDFSPLELEVLKRNEATWEQEEKVKDGERAAKEKADREARGGTSEFLKDRSLKDKKDKVFPKLPSELLTPFSSSPQNPPPLPTSPSSSPENPPQRNPFGRGGNSSDRIMPPYSERNNNRINLIRNKKKFLDKIRDKY